MAPPLFEFDFDEKTGEIIFVKNRLNEPITTNPLLWHQFLYIILSIPMTVWGLLVVVRLRKAIRTKYNIPTGWLGKYEDFLCVCLCNCCTLSQMARQTMDYKTERASCCSPNGVIINAKQQQQPDDDDNDDYYTDKTHLALVPAISSSVSTCSSVSSESSFSASSSKDRSRNNNNNNNNGAVNGSCFRRHTTTTQDSSTSSGAVSGDPNNLLPWTAVHKENRHSTTTSSTSTSSMAFVI
jgi:Cys-rich protein (TIGR01571 family)